jgi:formate dehydrogenase subunit gamma
MAGLFGGLTVCRWLHPWAGILFFLSSLAMFLHWASDMRLVAGDREWLGSRALRYLKHQAADPDVGKYNGGQKLFFYAVSLGALGLLVSGVVLWFPLRSPQILREAAILLHDVTFVLFTIAIVFHIYLGTAAEPGTFQAMTRGTVRRGWARLHHPRWYREVTSDDQRSD